MARGRPRKQNTRMSMANGSAPDTHSRLRVNEDGTKRFRFRTVPADNSKTCQSSVLDYAKAVRAAKSKFTKEMGKRGIAKVLNCTRPQAWTVSEPDDANLSKWLKRSTMKLDFVSDYANGKTKPKPKQPSKHTVTLPIFACKSYSYTLTEKKHELSSLKVDNILRSAGKSKAQQTAQVFFAGGPILAIKVAPNLASDGKEVVFISTVANEVTWEHDPEIPTYLQFWKTNPKDLSVPAQLWFLLKVGGVGNVVDACWCPCFDEGALAKGKNFDDVVGFVAVTCDSGTIAIFRIDNDLGVSSSSADDPLIVEVAPMFELRHPVVLVKELASETVSGDSQPLDESELKQDADESVVTEAETPPRKLLPKRLTRQSRCRKSLKEISDDEDESENREETPSSEESEPEEEDDDEEEWNKKGKKRRQRSPVVKDFELKEIDVFVERTIHSAPFTSVDWSPFRSGRDVLAVSASGWIIFWDLESHPDGEPVQALFDDSWEAPVTTARWISEDEIVVGFRSKQMSYYNVRTRECYHTDSTSRATGTKVETQLISFPGVISYDVVRLVTKGNQVQYAVGMYQVLDQVNEIGLIAPLPNKHQGQVFHANICDSSGVLGSVGIDGRFVESLVGRMTPRYETRDFPCNVLRPALQLLRHRLARNEASMSEEEYEQQMQRLESNNNDSDASNVPHPIIEQEKVAAMTWLEVRFGDATLIDQKSGQASDVDVEAVTFDRRTEILTRVEFSRHTSGVAMTGGEAGLVFVLPTPL